VIYIIMQSYVSVFSTYKAVHPSSLLG